MTIVDKIRLLCKERQTTITQLEVELGFSRGAISKWTKSEPGATKVAAVASWFGVSSAFLLGLDIYEKWDILYSQHDEVIRQFIMSAPTDDVYSYLEGIGLVGKDSDLSVENYVLFIKEHVQSVNENSEGEVEVAFKSQKSDNSSDTISITEDEFTYAMYNEGKELTEEQKQSILDMARFLKSQNINDKKEKT